MNGALFLLTQADETQSGDAGEADDEDDIQQRVGFFERNADRDVKQKDEK